MAELVEKALQIALSQNGVRERGENTGKEVDAYLRSTGCRPGNPWCAAFVYWSINQAADALDVPNPFVRSAYCPDLAGFGRQNGIFDSTPERGAVFLRYGTVDGEFRACHTGFVTGVAGGKFQTVEGNTNDGGSREGIGVFLRSRPVSDTYKFIHWGKLAQEPETELYQLVLSGRAVCQMPVRNGQALCSVRTWGAALGLPVGWDENEHLPTLAGQALDADVAVIDNAAYAPIRQLAANSGLKLAVDTDQRVVNVSRG